MVGGPELVTLQIPLAMSTTKDWHQWIGTKTEPQVNALAEMLSVISNLGIWQKLQKHNPAQFKKDELYKKRKTIES